MEAMDLKSHQLVLLRQIHSDRTIVVDGSEPSGEKPLGPADGVILLTAGRFAVIRTADCLPVIAVLPRQRRVCCFHAGWRGTRDRIVEKGMSQFLKTTGAAPGEVTVALGPSIRKCCYEVGPEVRQRFAASGHDVEELFSDRHLDLVKANHGQLQHLGIQTILDSEMCTACRTDLFYSYRREGETGRLWTLAGFRDTDYTD